MEDSSLSFRDEQSAKLSLIFESPDVSDEFLLRSRKTRELTIDADGLNAVVEINA